VEIRTRLDGEEMRIELEGRLDAAWSGTVGKTLQETLHAGCHGIALDLSKVSYLSSAGIRVLVMLVKQLKGIGGRLRILDASPPVREVLKLVGFQNLLEDSAASPPQPPSTAPRRKPAGPRHRQLDIGEHGFEIHELNAGTAMRGALIGDPEQAFGDAPRRPVSLSVPADTLAIGLGALGGDADCGSRAGELLAVDGLAIALPGDDPAHPDWLSREGDLVPEVSLLHGLKAQGAFRHLLRFGATPDAPALRLSELALAALEIGECDQAAFVAVAETASLVGAALQVPPSRVAEDWLAFPGIRDRLLFTAEPAYADETCLIVGLVARRPVPPLAAFLRPMGGGSSLSAHLHAAVMPYRPVHKGLIGLRDTLEALMESQTVRGVLHLLNDDREGVGAGESYLRRGALWCAPVNFNEGDSLP
jgi:anti-anti-sigma factor